MTKFKKLLLTLAASLVALSAQAIDYYLIGGFNGWATAQANCKFTPQGDGTYVLDYNGTLTSGFKINDGTWSNDAANFGGSSTLQIGVTYNLTVGGSSGNIPLSENITNPHIVLNPSAKTLLITGQATEAKTMYGIHSNWFDSNWSTINLTEQSDGTWKLEKRTIPAGTFGIKAMDASTGGQTAWISADGTSVITPNTAMPCKVEGTNFTNPAGDFEVVFDPKAMTLTLNGTQTGEDVKPDYDSWYVNVFGPFNNYQDNGVNPVNGISTTENLAIGTSGFKIKVWNGSDFHYVSPSGSVPVNEWTALEIDDYEASPTQIEGAKPSSVYTVKFNCETNEVYVTLTSQDEETVYSETMYVIGYVNNGAFNPTNGVEMTKEANGVYTAKSVKIGEDPNGDGYFSFTETLGSDDNDWDSMTKRYGAQSKDLTPSFEQPNRLTTEKDNAFKVEPGFYDMTVSLVDMTLTITVGEAIPDPFPEECYFIGTVNTNGSWNMEPTPGTPIPLNNDGDGYFTLEGVELYPENGADYAYFNIITKNTNSWSEVNGFRYGPEHQNDVVTSGEEIELNMNNYNAWPIDPGVYDVTVAFDEMYVVLDLVSELPIEDLKVDTGVDDTVQSGSVNEDLEISLQSLNDKVIFFVTAPEDATAVYYKVEVTGQVTTGGSDDSQGTEPGLGAAIRGRLAAQEGYTEAKTYVAPEDAGDKSDNGKYYVPLTTGTTGTVDLYYESSAYPYTSTPVTYNYTVTRETPTGVEVVIEAADGEVQYFNLDGVRVYNPEKGIFIKVANGKAEKVVK